MTTPLGEQQRKFVSMVGRLIAWTYLQPGHALSGAGIAHSLHTDRLAVDFNLILNGVYQTDTKAYEPLGIYWESLGGSWGGRFSKPDGNHFSLAYGRRK